jgi:hypothetical protein
MRTRILLSVAAAALLVGLVPAPAGAVTSTSAANITATITAGGIGSRTIAALPITMTSLAGNGKVSGAYSVTVLETAATGVNPWSVTTAVSELTSAVDSSKIAPSAFDISTPTVLGVPTAGTDTATTGSVYSVTGAATTSDPLTLWTNTGQSALAVYTSTHTATGTLAVTPPNGAKTGAYTGTLTFTLFN